MSILYQYKRLANVYNLIIGCITLVPGISPYPPITWVGPMIFVLMVSVIREGIEDAMRYNQDLKTNG
jgi:phospholipid-transporting ATPase